MTKQRKAAIRKRALDYLSVYVVAVLDCDPGPHPIATTEDEHAYLEAFIKEEGAKLRGRARRTRSP